MARYANIIDTIGKTPLVRINRMAPDHVNLYVKVESFNPMGSVKDRMARAIIEDAEQSGELQPGQTVIEATSGNTGIGLAMVCAQKGYPLVVTMAENFSVERRKMLRFLGAKVVLTPASEKGFWHVEKGRRARREAWLVPLPPVRKPCECPGAHRNDGSRDSRGHAGRKAVCVRHGLRHGRDLERRRARIASTLAPHAHRCGGTGQRASVGQRHPAAAGRRGQSERQSPEFQAAPDAGLEPGFHLLAHGRSRCERIHRQHSAGSG